MHCPVDHSVELVTISVDGVSVEHCVTCNGHWLQHGELAKLASRDATAEPAASVSRSSRRFCPADTSPLTEVEFPQHSNLKIDVCPQCQGIWLDANELGQALTQLGRKPQQGISTELSRPVLDLLVRLTGKR